MTTLGIALVIVFVLGIAVAAYAILAPRRRVALEGPTPPPRDYAIDADAEWAREAGREFAALSETARCDMIFAVATLDSQEPLRLLEYALGDSSEAVALAAAHALARNGRRPIVERYLATHPGDRAERIAQTLALLDIS